MPLNPVRAFVPTITFGFNVRRVRVFGAPRALRLEGWEIRFFYFFALNECQRRQDFFPRSVQLPAARTANRQFANWGNQTANRATDTRFSVDRESR